MIQLKFTAGDTFEYLNGSGEKVWQSGLHLPEKGHWQAVSCYGGTEMEARAVRDCLLKAVTNVAATPAPAMGEPSDGEIYVAVSRAHAPADLLAAGDASLAMVAAIGEELPPLPDKVAIRAGHSFPKVYALGHTDSGLQDYGRACMALRQPGDASLIESMRNLALAIWRDNYKSDSPNFNVLSDAAGILSQIDNMVCGMTRAAIAAAPVSQPAASGESPCIEDRDGIPAAMRMVIESKGSHEALRGLYRLVNTWGAEQRAEAKVSQPAAPSPTYDAWAADNLPQYVSGSAPTWADVEVNVHIETRNAWDAAIASCQPAAQEVSDPIVELNVAMLRKRSAVGVEKYGVTMADAGLDHRAWLLHALEEVLDQANYLQAAIQTLPQRSPSASPPFDDVGRASSSGFRHP